MIYLSDFRFISADLYKEFMDDFMDGVYESVEHLRLAMEEADFQILCKREGTFEERYGDGWNEPYSYYTFIDHPDYGIVEVADIEEKFYRRKRVLDEKYNIKRIA